jgi:hypothetical protein
MHLFRDHIGLGSWLGLIALALNLALSFGHIHAIGNNQHLVVAAVGPADADQTGHHGDGLPDDLCPICMATASMGSALAGVAPILPHPVAYALTARVIEAILVFVEPSRAAFQSRAPPIS